MRPIDGDALADYLDDELLNECFSGQEIRAEDAVRMALRKVLDAPTLDVAPVVHASWRGNGKGCFEGELVYYEWFCGNCNQLTETERADVLPKFCPNCGAKMDAEVHYDPQTV